MFKDNNATQQDAQGQANVPLRIVFHPISNNDPAEDSMEARRSALSFDLFSVVSGVPIEFALNITDHNGVLYKVENHATAEVSVKAVLAGKTARLVGNKSFATDGVIYFHGLIIVADPDSELTLSLKVGL